MLTPLKSKQVAKYIFSTSILLSLNLLIAHAQENQFSTPPGTISCTSEVASQVCKTITHELRTLQAFMFVHTVQFIITDPPSFEEEKRNSVDIAIAKFSSSSTPMIHSSLDDQILFQVTKASAVHCPDRVVISSTLFHPAQESTKSGPTRYVQGVDADLLSEYGMFIVGYIEGCWGRK